MPRYVASPDVVSDMETLVRGAVRTPAIASALAEARLSEHVIVSEMITDPFLEVRARQLYRKVLSRAAKLRQHDARKPEWRVSDWRPTYLQVACLAGALAWPVAVALVVFSLVFSAPWLLHVVTVVGMLHFDPVTRHFLKSGVPESVWQRMQWGRQRRLMRLRLPISRGEWRQAVREEVVLPELRLKIHQHQQLKFSLDLQIFDASGLRSADDLASLVETEPVKRLIEELERTDEGAIALAGQRGTGKTTLLRALAKDLFPDPKPRLTVSASAPVNYDPRDFVLHLHAVVCRSLLDRLRVGVTGGGGDETEQRWLKLRLRENRRAAWVDHSGRAVRRLGWVLLYLVVANMVDPGGQLALAEYFEQLRIPIGVPRQDVYDWAGSLAPERLVALVLVALAGAVAASWALGALLRVGGWGFRRLLRGLAGRLQVTFRDFRRSDLLARFFTSLARVLSVLGLDSLTPRWRPVTKRRPVDFSPQFLRLGSDLTALRRLAQEQLRHVRYLQTRTAGWSGKFSSVKGISLGLDRSVQEAEQPLTYPEVVDRFRNFANHAGSVLARSRAFDGITIVIDEVDKVADAETAHKFINDIKGVFLDVERCVFIVSVSEDALTSFERRGVPVRDAMDSAFHTMIAMTPFDIQDTKNWLSRRVVGLSQPYVALCHCLSGGVPRELYRVARAVLRLYRRGEARRLGETTHSLVWDEIERKIGAFSRAARESASAHEVHKFIVVLEGCRARAGVWKLLVASKQLQEMAEADEGDGADLRREAAAYLYLCATLLEYFSDDLEESQHGEDWLDESHGLPRLASARTALAVSPALAWQHVAAFRRHHGMDTALAG